MPRTNVITASRPAAHPGQIGLAGNTYGIRRQIAAMGGTWDADLKLWLVPESASASLITLTAEHAIPLNWATDASASSASTASTASNGAAASPPPPPPAPPVPPTPAPTPAPAAGGLDAYIIELIKRYAPQGASVDEKAVLAIVEESLKSHRLPITVEVKTERETRAVTGAAHPQLATLIRCLGAGLNVWLAGPSGSGKTHGAEQAAEALGLRFFLQGSMTMSHELIGFVDAGGRYHVTPFVEAFENGGLILLDECDAGSSEALLTLNAALANGVMSLPDGRMVKRHAEFRCIAGANTFGAGATAEYVGRAKIDAAFLQRFGARIVWGYDETLERAIAGNDSWVARVQRARAKAQAAGLKVLITPRQSVAGAKLIAAGMTPDEAARLTYLSGLTEAQVQQIEG